MNQCGIIFSSNLIVFSSPALPKSNLALLSNFLINSDKDNQLDYAI